MKVKVAQYIADFLVSKQVKHVFMVTGGGAMHLNDALGHKEELACIYNHHEQASAIAAEGYARLTGKIAAVCVTSGPGGTNAITGVLGGWQDSIPMFVISGQVKRETTTWSTNVPLRQLGDQEFQIAECVKGMTKYVKMVTEPTEIRYHLEKAWYLANSGRKGPVWLDIPLDVQATIVEINELQGFEETKAVEIYEKENPVYDNRLTEKVLVKIKQAERPVILAGTGIRLSGAYEEFRKLINKWQVPVVTAWNAHDLLEDEHPLCCGRPGSVGTRGGNFVVQNSDLLIVLGCRMNIRQISYNYKEFAKRAYKIVVDIDEGELRKPTVNVDIPIHADVADVMKNWNQAEESLPDFSNWLAWCRNINGKYPAVLERYYTIKTPVNPYVFIKKLSLNLSDNDKIICGNGSACVVTFQAIEVKKGQRIFTNSGCAAMGYGFPAAIGSCIAMNNQRTICIDGDGSFQMNMQELQTVVHHHLNLKIVILNNNGYHSIRQTQNNLFKKALVGVDSESGISFPDMEKLAYAYGISYVKIKSVEEIDEKLQKMLSENGSCICEVFCDVEQNFEPKLSSKVLDDGTIVSPEIDDMYPFLSREEYEANQLS